MSYDPYHGYHSQAGMTKRLTLICITLGMFAWAISSALHAAELGRLFFTPKERAQLEQAQTSKQIPGSANSAVILNGIVQRHNGPRTEWINGVPQNAGTSDGKAPDSLSITLPDHSRPIKLKVGEQLKSTQPLQNSSSEPALKTEFPSTPE
ncbi:MAG: hypothetical protein ABL865_03490 [Candidatus Nitrotoga sp.]